jgi:hypothetical protein
MFFSHASRGVKYTNIQLTERQCEHIHTDIRYINNSIIYITQYMQIHLPSLVNNICERIVNDALNLCMESQ